MEICFFPSLREALQLQEGGALIRKALTTSNTVKELVLAEELELTYITKVGVHVLDQDLPALWYGCPDVIHPVSAELSTGKLTLRCK